LQKAIRAHGRQRTKDIEGVLPFRSSLPLIHSLQWWLCSSYCRGPTYWWTTAGTDRCRTLFLV